MLFFLFNLNHNLFKLLLQVLVDLLSGLDVHLQYDAAVLASRKREGHTLSFVRLRHVLCTLKHQHLAAFQAAHQILEHLLQRHVAADHRFVA
jgi:hypothetical protein